MCGCVFVFQKPFLDFWNYLILSIWDEWCMLSVAMPDRYSAWRNWWRDPIQEKQHIELLLNNLIGSGVTDPLVDTTEFAGSWLLPGKTGMPAGETALASWQMCVIMASVDRFESKIELMCFMRSVFDATITGGLKVLFCNVPMIKFGLPDLAAGKAQWSVTSTQSLPS